MDHQLKYFRYVRKSTEGTDRQVLSIEGQLTELNKLIEQNNLSIVETFTESKSAHIPNNRPKFNEMVKRINKGEANGLIVWHTNRISRNPKESGEIQQMLQDGKIASIMTPYRHFKTEDNSLLFSIETSEANQYSRDLSLNVKRGLRQKYDMGHPPSYAQLGYLNTKSNIRGTNKIIEDPERWHIVRKGFDLFLSGDFSVSQVLDILNNQYGLRTRPGNIKGGKPLSKAGIYRILTNPFYYGYFYCKGSLYKGAYKPMITLEEFDQIQNILGRKGKPRPKRHAFPFTGLIKCGVCGSAITATRKEKLIKSTGKLKSFTFYYCTRRKKSAETCTEKTYLTAHYLEQTILEELSQYQIRKSFIEWAMVVINENFQQEVDKHQKLIEAETSFEKRIQQELSNLVDLRISNGISELMYLQKKAEKDEQLIRIQSKKVRLVERVQNWVKRIETYFSFTVNLAERFKNSNPSEKKSICKEFGWNWILKDQKLIVSKQEWLEPFKKYKNSVEGIFGQLEPEKTFDAKGTNASFEVLRPLVCGLVDEVRTNKSIQHTFYNTNPP